MNLRSSHIYSSYLTFIEIDFKSQSQLEAFQNTLENDNILISELITNIISSANYKYLLNHTYLITLLYTFTPFFSYQATKFLSQIISNY